MNLLNPLTNPFIQPEAHRINARRLEHLQWLDLPLDPHNDTVLEVGAGQGMLSSYWLDRKFKITITDGRRSNVKLLKKKFRGQEVYNVDLNWFELRKTWDIIFCYGTLYHCEYPGLVLKRLNYHTNKLLLLETCVSTDAVAKSFKLIEEPQDKIDQSISGVGCRPARNYVWQALKMLFPYVYMPTHQPAHPDFPTDWEHGVGDNGLLKRVVFIGSNIDLSSNPKLTTDYLNKQQSL